MLACYVVTLDETGVRSKSQGLWLRWKDVHMDDGFLWIDSGRNAHRTKSGKGRTGGCRWTPRGEWGVGSEEWAHTHPPGGRGGGPLPTPHSPLPSICCVQVSGPAGQAPSRFQPARPQASTGDDMAGRGEESGTRQGGDAPTWRRRRDTPTWPRNTCGPWWSRNPNEKSCETSPRQRGLLSYRHRPDLALTVGSSAPRTSLAAARRVKSCRACFVTCYQKSLYVITCLRRILRRASSANILQTRWNLTDRLNVPMI